MKIITTIISKIITIDNISSLIAKLISKLLKNASEKGGDKWDKAKKTISKIRIWIDLFDEVYADDNMTKEEEDIVSKAIESEIDTDSIKKILNKSQKEVK